MGSVENVDLIRISGGVGDNDAGAVRGNREHNDMAAAALPDPNLLLGPSSKGKSFDLRHLDFINRDLTDFTRVRGKADVTDHCVEVVATHNYIDHLMQFGSASMIPLGLGVLVFARD